MTLQQGVKMTGYMVCAVLLVSIVLLQISTKDRLLVVVQGISNLAWIR